MVTLDNLAVDIMDIVNDYSDNVKIALEKKLDETSLKIIDYVKNNAPRSGGSNALADSFVTKTNGDGINKVITIYSEKKGRIVHLLEFGFKHKSGKFIQARPFMRPSFDINTSKMLEDIKQIIGKGGR